MNQNLTNRQLTRNGFAVLPSVLNAGTLLDVRAAVEQSDLGAGIRHGGEVYAIRTLLDTAPAVRALARSAELRSVVEPVLGSGSFAVKALLLDKTPTANWTVPWHQDLAIAVRRRMDAAGYSGWSEKSEIAHVIPPVEVLESMLTVRVALDDGGEDNGPLLVLPGSHLSGRISDADSRMWRSRVAPAACPVPRGGALLMRPLLLHASHPARLPSRRRVLHLDYAAAPLPGGVEWRWAVYLSPPGGTGRAGVAGL